VLTETELETILAESRAQGARAAGYILLRLPHELKQLFRDWLQCHYPNRVEHVMNRISEMHGGREYDHQYGQRMRGVGLYADMLAKRFNLALKKLGYAQSVPLDSRRFNPSVFAAQYSLFD
ncbi:MAG: radical SAM protein, partial [Gammaproteobacteria bacterium]|nr:radical SAM protein [Gammaproteobacteria bacterium]